ncbi:MAG: nucleotidyl transferase AbiEii/AbiGii toxin family protein [Verrucomicrobia bacterium]|nr:nucleotidyl transferase AbiEii/AbiGii toxin family protein [Verrucomicrobiota bacterium]
MAIKIIEDKLKKYRSLTKQQEKNALREIAQEIALSALARTDFFKHAAFIGGSCLRIVYDLQRFSEDLDFWTLKPAPNFLWKPYLQVVADEFKAYAFDMAIVDRECPNAKVKRAILKKDSDSIEKVLILSDVRKYTENEKLQIKFEIHTHPPAGGSFEPKNIDFPYPFSITALDRPSLFASKVAALFDPTHDVKGRHWYDFIWYIFNKWPINYKVFANAYNLLGGVLQVNPEQVTLSWLQEKLAELIQSIDWKAKREDVRNFISSEEQETLNLWSPQFFLGYVEALGEYLKPIPISLGSLIADNKGAHLIMMVKEALASGANVDDDSRNGHRPLQMALSKGYKEVAKLLIEHGADPNYRDRSGLTPLQAAVNHGQFENAKLLIKKGAAFNPNAPNLAFDYQKLYQFLRNYH